MTPEVERLLESANLAEAEGNLGEALIGFEGAARLAADEALPRLRLGTLRYRIRDYLGAGEALAEAARLDPENAEIAFRLGLTCDALGDREQAQAAFARTMMLAPSSWQTWFLIGRDHRQLGHAEVARLAYRRALDAAPDEPELQYELGTLLWEMGMRDEGFACLERAVRACPVDPAFTLRLALGEMGRANLPAAPRLVATGQHLDPGERRIDLALQDLWLRRKIARKGKRAA